MKERAVCQAGGSKSFKDHVISADLHQQGDVCAFSEGDFKKGFTNVYAGLQNGRPQCRLHRRELQDLMKPLVAMLNMQGAVDATASARQVCVDEPLR